MWYYQSEDGEHGPVDAGAVKELLNQQVITAASVVWREGMEDWMRLDETELASFMDDLLKSGRSPPLDRNVRQQSPPGRGKKIITLPRLAFFFIFLITAILGGIMLHIRPLSPQEYLYNRSTIGEHTRYPFLGEDHSLLVRRFAGAIHKDEEIPGGRRLWIRDRDCDHLVFVQAGRVEAVLILSPGGSLTPSALAKDLVDRFGRTSPFELMGDNLWWNESLQAALAIKSARSVLLSTEKGLPALTISPENIP